ncbi:hypothetical protein GJU40_08070 [Bacillus lacus]|uniref:Uncharacterized protein n=1 Tax=Metabacillus lacus TaxID=1983721 RepID=A0A7X2IYQ1_9BACI|nr:hypothetical protein [Metabacillus lacus]MRX72116.1 hypothetical protein [Metabacillus lacus]
MLRIKGDNGRIRWFSFNHFHVNGEKGDEVTDEPNQTNWIEISMTMSDESKRWCILYTPERLKNLLQQEHVHPKGLHIKHMIIVKSYKKKMWKVFCKILTIETN